MATIVDVAKKAGVCNATVSRVINHVPGVAESLRQAVLDAMKELDYHPSPRRPGPKPLSRRGIRTGNVLALFAGFEPGDLYRLPIFSTLLDEIESALAGAGLSLMIAGFRADKPRPSALSGDQIDGAILVGNSSDITDSMHRWLSDIPTVVLLRSQDELPGPYDRVIYNNKSVGPMAANHLLQAGHKYAAFFNHNSSHVAFAQRQKNFTQTFTAGGGRVLELEQEMTKTNYHEVIDEFVDRATLEPPELTAICAASDYILPYLYRALRAKGIEPQTQLSIISCDNDELSIGPLDPSPATIDIRIKTIGQHAIRQLQWRLANPDDEDHITITIEPKLILP